MTELIDTKGSRSRIPCSLGLGVVVLLGFVCLWSNREAASRAAADFWAVSDHIETADAVVVLGGGVKTRPFVAADLYKAGIVKTVLVTAVKPEQEDAQNAKLGETDLNRAVLVQRGVPSHNVTEIGDNVSSTYEEALAVRDWAQRTGAHRIIIVTEKFSSRRVQWIFRRELADLAVQAIVYSVGEPGYDFRSWWSDRYGALKFASEVLKYLYYRFKY